MKEWLSNPYSSNPYSSLLGYGYRSAMVISHDSVYTERKKERERENEKEKVLIWTRFHQNETNFGDCLIRYAMAPYKFNLLFFILPQD